MNYDRNVYEIISKLIKKENNSITFIKLVPGIKLVDVDNSELIKMIEKHYFLTNRSDLDSYEIIEDLDEIELTFYIDLYSESYSSNELIDVYSTDSS